MRSHLVEYGSITRIATIWFPGNDWTIAPASRCLLVQALAHRVLLVETMMQDIIWLSITLGLVALGFAYISLAERA